MLKKKLLKNVLLTNDDYAKRPENKWTINSFRKIFVFVFVFQKIFGRSLSPFEGAKPIKLHMFNFVFVL